MIIDKIRSEGISNVNTLFELMDRIYGTIYPLAVYDNLIARIRKKLDISRLLIENVRAIITEEKRRTVNDRKNTGIRKKAYEFRTFQIIVTITHIQFYECI
jgi:hypothetical protein